MIRRFILTIAALLTIVTGAQGQSPVTGWCQQGGAQVQTSGLLSTTRVQRSFPSCTVTIFDAGTSNPATIFSDAGGTPLGNPFSASATGYYQFFANNGTYDVRLSSGGIPLPFIERTVKISDATSGIGGTGTANRVAKFTGGATIGNSQITDNGVSVGINNTSPSANAILDLTSTVGGFLPPRMTTAQRDAIAGPSAGLVIYNTTTSALNIFSSGVWGAIAGGTGISSLNTLTAATQTFALGTSGADVNISSVTSTHTFNFPDAGTGARGLVTTLAQSFAGQKTFTGRVLHTPTPVFDLAAGTLASDMLLPHAGVTVATGLTYDSIRITQTDGSDNTWTAQGTATISGIRSSQASLSGSNANSNVYGMVAHSSTEGPGTAKGIHAEGFGIGIATGTIVAVNAQIQPVATQSTAWAIQASSTGVANIANGMAFVQVGGSNWRYGIDFVANGGNVYTSGAIRLPNNVDVVARNAANSADVPIFRLDTVNSLSIPLRVSIAGTGLSGAGLSGAFTQTQPNAADTSDSAASLSYTLTANSATNELVVRALNFTAVNNLTGGGTVQNLRAFNLTTNTNAGTTTSNLAGVYIESGVTLGTVTNGYGIFISNLQGATQYGIWDQSGGRWHGTGPTDITNTSATAFGVGTNAFTNPTFQVDNSVASTVTGLKITGAAAGNGIGLASTSSAADEDIIVTPKGTGQLTVNNNLQLNTPSITPVTGTGFTVNETGVSTRVTYKTTVTEAAYTCAALTCDLTIATLPAKTRLVSIIADTTIPYSGGGVTAASMIVGKTVGGNEYLLTHSVFGAGIVRGLVTGDMGAVLASAAGVPVQGGDLPSWTATTNISVRITTVTANVVALTAGSTTFYITTEKMP